MKMKWPSDPPTPPIVRRIRKIGDRDENRWWDFNAATEAAQLLQASLPNMLKHWEGLQWSPETRDGYQIIKTLNDALLPALSYIEWPFGKYERTKNHKKQKPWHTYAHLISRIVIDALVEAGHENPGISRNSVVVRIVQNTLIHIDLPGSKMVTKTAVGAYLTRWDKRFGLTPEGIAVLTTKQATAVCDRAG